MFNIQIPELSYDLCYRAKMGVSHTPDDSAKRTVNEFEEVIKAYIADFEQYDVEANPNQHTLEQDIQRFIDGYYSRYTTLLNAETRHVSAFIAGPSGYPARQMEKRMGVIDRRREEMLTYLKTAENSLRLKHDPDRKRAIDSGDADAIEQLTKQLEAAEAYQAMMKTANTIARSKKLTEAEKVTRLTALPGINEATARQLLCTDYPGVGFPKFELTNNGATIRRLKQRIAAVAALQEAKPVSYESDAFTVYEDAGANRIRIEHAVKPSETVRDWLKSHGWNWSPANGCWQRKITENARQYARQFIAVWR